MATHMPTQPPPMGAHVEIIEPYTTERTTAKTDEDKQRALDTLPCIKPYRVRINGTDVGLITKDGVQIDPGPLGQGPDGNGMTVTITLLVKSVSIHAE